MVIVATSLNSLGFVDCAKKGGQEAVKSLWTTTDLCDPLAASDDFIVAFCWVVLASIAMASAPPFGTSRHLLSNVLSPSILKDLAQFVRSNAPAPVAPPDNKMTTTPEAQQDKLNDNGKQFEDEFNVKASVNREESEIWVVGAPVQKKKENVGNAVPTAVTNENNDVDVSDEDRNELRSRLTHETNKISG